MRCNICDYTSTEGSFLLDRGPGRSRVHDYHGEYLCDDCAAEIDEQNDYFYSLDEDD